MRARTGDGRTDRLNARRVVRQTTVALLCLVLPVVCGLAPERATATGSGCRVAGPDGSATRVECAPGFASERDVVLVYGGRRAVAVGEPWQPELQDEVWLLQPGGLPRTALIIRFSGDADGRARAEVFDDVDGDGHVGFIVVGTAVRVVEGAGLPRIRVLADGGWWRKAGRINFNLELAVDGPVHGMIDSPVYLHALASDGSDDLVVQVRDANGDGRPELEWRQAYPPLDDSDGYNHTSVMVNTQDDEQELDPAPLPWPFLATNVVDLVKPYFRSPPPIQVDWERGRIRLLGEFVASRAEPGSFFVYSQQRLGVDRPATANFEAPFAFYRLDPDGTYPDVAIRHVYFGPDDPYSPTREAGTPMQQVDFSWRQVGLLRGDLPVWDYKLSLAGRNEVRHPMALGPLSVNLLPFDGLLPWIIGQRWDFATFVAREGPGYASSEGLYEWYPLEHSEPDGRRYLAGLSSDDPSSHFQDITPGHRGEAVFDLANRPWLYVSAVDRRLHLKHAAYGIWRDDQGGAVRYRSVAGGPYVDEWALERDGTVLETLRHVGGVLILTANEGCALKSLPSAALFEALPPDSPAAWLDLRQRLAGAALASSAPDFGAMFDGVVGEPTIVAGCLIDAVARTAEQISFRLTLTPDFRIDRDTEAAAFLSGLRPGRYVVTVESGRLTASRLAGSALSPGRPVLVEPGPTAPAPMELADPVLNADDLPAGRASVSPEGDLLASSAPLSSVGALLAAQGLTGTLPLLLAALLVLASAIATAVAVAVVGGGFGDRPAGRTARPAGRASRGTGR